MLLKIPLFVNDVISAHRKGASPFAATLAGALCLAAIVPARGQDYPAKPVRASFCHLANIAMRLERKLHWDPKKETFANDDEANSMVSRQQREGYRIDVDV